MDSLENDLDITRGKIEAQDRTIEELRNEILVMSDQIRDLQMYLSKMARTQAGIVKRMSMWPYIPIERERKE